MKSPEHIKDLIQLLSQTPKTNYNSILNTFDFEAVDFKPFQHWSSKKYTRNCIYKDAQFELLLLCWDTNQETSVHDHDGEDCWVYVLEGELEEIFYTIDNAESLREERSQLVKPHQLSFMNDQMGFHKLRNRFKGKAMSLHLYAKPIAQCSFYCETSQQFIERKLNYDTVKALTLTPETSSI